VKSLRLIMMTLALLPGLLPGQESVPVPPCTTGRVIQVVLPGTVCAAVSDKLRLAVFGHKGPTDFQITAVPLAASGIMEPGQAFRLTLEKPDTLKAFTVSALDLVFHPVLPLLYVWSDVAYPFPPNKPADNPALRDFDHLTVYAVSNRMLSRVGSFARGPDYAYGQESGRLALDPGGRRLFLPNIRPGRDKTGIGYLPITSNGLPLVSAENELKLVSVDLSDYIVPPTGQGMACFNEKVICLGSSRGLITWDTGNRLGAVSRILLFNWPDKPVFTGAHPAVPAIFMATGNMVGMIPAADGYPTLLPVAKTVPEASFTCAPVVLPGAPAVAAVGGVNAVYLRGLNPVTGGFTGSDSVVAVTNPAVRALAASTAWNRLYIPVEALP
jgi:hypothetical protein